MTLSKLSKKKNTLGYFGIIIIPFVTFLLGLTVGYNQAKHDTDLFVQGNTNSNTTLVVPSNNFWNTKKEINMDLFWDVWNQVENLYVDPSKLNTESMMYGAIAGMVNAIEDPYTLFMNPKQSEEFRNNLSGDLQGIGAELSVKDGLLVIVSPLKDSPAEKAGLLSQDVIYKIDDHLASSMSFAEAVLKIRGKQGTTVHLSIVRGGKDAPLEFDIQRQDIRVPSITWEMKENTFAYIRIDQFGDDTTKEFENALNTLLLKKPKGVILDLRFNGGGYLDGAVDVVSEFLEEGVVTIIRQRSLHKDETEKVHGNARFNTIPLVVLINGGSASASEIVAGAIKENKRGILMGEKTFGKGTVQEPLPLPDGSTLRITIAKWLTPNGNDIDGVGITPDIEVKDIDPKDAVDEQLQRALSYLKEKK